MMKHIKTLNTKNLQNTVKKGGCGECQTSCQSACKTSCTVGNQSCEIQNKRRLSYAPRVQTAVTGRCSQAGVSGWGHLLMSSEIRGGEMDQH